MHQPDPTFPPLLTGHGVKSPTRAFEHALEGARAGTFSAGDLVWSHNTQRLECALVLEPEVSRARSMEILHVGMVAFADAFGALAPPEVGVLYRWPNRLRINKGEIGMMRLVASNNSDSEGVPDWLVLDLGIQIRPARMIDDPGTDLDFTNLMEEGCGEITRSELLESYARHLLTWIHNWSADGFRSVHDTWMDRAEDEESEITLAYEGETLIGTFMGLDESGNLLLREGEKTRLLSVENALGNARDGS